MRHKRSDPMQSHRARILRSALIVMGAILLLLGGVHLLLKYRVSRWKARMVAQGEKLTIADCVPPETLSADNAFSDLMRLSGQLSALQQVVNLRPPALRTAASDKGIPVQALTNWIAAGGQSRGSAGTVVSWEMLDKELAAATNLI